MLEWVTYPFSSRSSWPRKGMGVSCIAGRLSIELSGKPKVSESWPNQSPLSKCIRERELCNHWLFESRVWHNSYSVQETSIWFRQPYRLHEFSLAYGHFYDYATCLNLSVIEPLIFPMTIHFHLQRKPERPRARESFFPQIFHFIYFSSIALAVSDHMTSCVTENGSLIIFYHSKSFTCSLPFIYYKVSI